MHATRSVIIKIAGALFLIGLFCTGCSDDDNPAKSTGSWAWRPMGGAADNWAEALTIHDGNLIAGGLFIEAGADTVNYIAEWSYK